MPNNQDAIQRENLVWFDFISVPKVLQITILSMQKYRIAMKNFALFVLELNIYI